MSTGPCCAHLLAKGADKVSREAGGVWRVHAVWSLNDERFSCFELTDESEGEHLDRAAVIPGEIRIGDRAYLQPRRIARVLAAGGDVVVRAPWNGARWQDGDGDAVDLTTLLALVPKGTDVVDRPIWMALSGTAGLKPEPRVAVRLVALRKPPEAAKTSLAKAVAESARRGSTLQPGTLIASEWLILVTSLPEPEFPASVIGDLYRLRRAEGARLRHGAHRGRLQAFEKRHRPVGAAGHRPALCQGPHPLAPAGEIIDRAALARASR